MKYLKVFTDFTIDMESLNDAERGRLFVAMLEYAAEGASPNLPGNERFLWGSAKKMIDAQQKAYEHRCEINRQNGNEPKRIGANRSESLRIVANGSESLQEQEQEQEQEQTKRKSNKKFSVPSIEEVKAYCTERNNRVNAEQFVSFYEAKGWKIGNQQMKDWKAAVRTWEQREKPKRNFAEREVKDEDFADLFLKL